MAFNQYECGTVGWTLSRLAIVFVLAGAGCGEGGGGGAQLPLGGTSGFPAASAGTGTMMNPILGSSGSGGTGGTMTLPTGGMVAPPTGGMMPTAGMMAAGGAGASAGSGGAMPTAGSAGAEPGGDHCLDGITDFASDGPFSFDEMSSGSVNIWVPDIPAGCKVPVVHLANGTGASCGSYQPILNRLASHGFLTTCYENPNTGAGTQGVMAIDTVFMMFPDKADTKIGSTGHSQGGQAAFTVLAQAEDKWGDSYTYAGLAMEPASGFGSQPSVPWQTMYATINSPMFMFSGTADILVSAGWVAQAFNALDDSIEAYNWSAVGATHVPVPNAETQEVAIPWFRWKLLGDNAACMAFKALTDGGGWNVSDEQNPQSCM